MSTRTAVIGFLGIGALLVLGLLLLGEGPGEGAVEAEAAPRQSVEHATPASLAPADEPRVGETSRQEEPERTTVSVEAPATEAEADEEEDAFVVLRVVRAGSGAPMPESLLLIRIEDVAKRSSVENPMRTDDTGELTLGVSTGRALRLHVDGRLAELEVVRRDLAPFEPGERREVLVELSGLPEREFHLRVLDDESGAPVAEAVVASVRNRFGSGFVAVSPKPKSRDLAGNVTVDECPELTRTDTLGRASVPRSARGNDVALVRAAGYGPLLVKLSGGHDTPASARELRLRRRGTVHARVRDAAGAPLEGVLVSLTTDAYHLGDAREGFVSASDFAWVCTTGSDGTCLIDDLPPDVPFVVELAGDGVELREPHEVLVEPGEWLELTWQLFGGALVHGRLFDDDGDPVKGKRVLLLGELHMSVADASGPALLSSSDERKAVQHTTSGEEGHFRFEDVAPGDWWVGVAPRGGIGWSYRAPDTRAIAPLAEHVHVAEGASSVEVDLRTHRGLYVSGKIVDPDGDPARCYVSARGTEVHGGATLQHSGIAEDGSFALGPLVPGEYRLRAHGFPEHASSETVVARAGDEGVVLELRQGCTLSGIVRHVGSADQPTSLVLSSSGKRSGARMANADSEGRFEMTRVIEGTYDLAAGARDGSAGVVRGLVLDPEHPLTDVEVVMSPGARLVLRYRGPEKYAQVRVLHESAVVHIDGLRAGTDDEAVVPAGRVEILWSTTSGESGTIEKELGPGEAASVEFPSGPDARSR